MHYHIKKYLPKFCLLLFCILHQTILISQGLLFNHFKVENGLSHYTVNSIYEDEFNRMWIGTREGLTIYDGGKPESITQNANVFWGSNVQTICGNHRGKIYIQCALGVTLFDIRSGTWNPIVKNNINCIYLGKNCLWMANKNSVLYYKEDSNKLIKRISLGKNVSITALFEDNDGLLYVGTLKNGVFIIGKNNQIRNIIDYTHVIAFYEDSRRNCWIGTVEHGLWRLKRNNELKNYLHNPKDKSSLPNNYIRAICQDDEGYIWVGSFKGLSKFDTYDETFTNFFPSLKDPYSLSNYSVWCITKDHQGSLWIGTYYGGVNYVNPKFSFQHFQNMDGSRLEGASIISDIAEDKNGNLWICSENEGLGFYNRKTNTFTNAIQKGNPSSISSNTVKSICIDEKRNSIWFGTYTGGLNKFDLKTKTFQRIHFNNISFPESYVRSIVYYNDRLYLGTKYSIIVYDIKTDHAEYLLDNNKFDLNNRSIWYMIKDSKNRLWFSTAQAVYRYDLETKTTKIYKHHSNNPRSLSPCYMNNFFEDKRHRIWVGSAGGGLNLYCEKTDDFEHITTKNSRLLNDNILAINQSPSGNLLIATNHGLSKYDIETRTFTNYKDIFPFWGMNERCLFVTSRNEIVVCSINGFIIFQERDLIPVSESFRININKIYINNRLVEIGPKSILKQAPLYTEKIVLKYEQNVIGIDFSTTNYINTIKPRLQYRLKNFNDNWIETDANGRITYTNLDPGNYLLQLRCINVENVASTDITELHIIVKPPFYRTWIAFLIYFFLIVYISLWLFRNYTSRIRLKTSLLFAQKEKERIEEMNQTKLKFFTNISHELRTPLTLIYAQLELMVQSASTNKSLQTKLNSCIKNLNKMRSLINALLDFRKLDTDSIELKVEEHDLNLFLNEMFDSFIDYAESKKIEFAFKSASTPVLVWFDAFQMAKAVNNLLSNAFKFTPENHSIVLTLEEKPDSVIFSVKDTGCGIPANELDHIFDLFYQAKNSNNNQSSEVGTGIGLAVSKDIIEAHHGKIDVISEIDKGSTFSVRLNKGFLHFAKKDFNNNENYSSKVVLQSQDTDSFSKEKPTILIVEDNEELLSVLFGLFEPFYNVLTAKDAEDGLQKGLKYIPDLILSDIVMYKMTGIELCKKLKNNFSTAHIPFILLTARTGEKSQEEALKSGADDYIEKPFNSKILLSKCNNFINARKTIEAHASKTPLEHIHSITTTNISDQDFINQAVKLVEANLSNENFDINNFAHEMYLGRTNLFSKIKSITGQTPNDFILNLRLNKSVFLLINKPDASILDIATMAGFGSAAYFIRCFKKEYGTTPAQFRKNELGKANDLE